MSRHAGRIVSLLAVAFHVLSAAGSEALPKRLVLLLDGVSYRDMKALQEGVTYKDLKGREFHRQAFHQGYFPVSRNVSTFPSASDGAWTEILGNRPLPGYQRTYFSSAADSEVFLNGVTSSMEYEKQMTWQVEGGFRRVMAYISPLGTFRYELNEMTEHFFRNKSADDNYYALIHATDTAQHLSGDIFAMLCTLEERLREMRARYRSITGRDLEVLMLSDHGNNHAGDGERVAIRPFLKEAGYRITGSIRNPKDVVLPTAGVESWVEVHNAPSETGHLVELLSRLEGVDVVTAKAPGEANRFIVMNSRGEHASIEWNPAANSFRYSVETGDPIGYQPAIAALARKHQLDANGFASAEAWLTETMNHRYPLALERIARGHTRVTLNPATILVSLKNGYVHCGWLIRRGSVLAKLGGTHGALDDVNSNGILLSNFTPTRDTSTSRVAALFDGFPGLRDFRAKENGAEWVSGKAHALASVARVPLDWCHGSLPEDELLLRVWTPSFTRVEPEASVEVTIQNARRYAPIKIRRGDPEPAGAFERCLTLNLPLPLPDGCAHERVYALPPDLSLEPKTSYRISGRVRDQQKSTPIFQFAFRTDDRGLPVAY